MSGRVMTSNTDLGEGFVESVSGLARLYLYNPIFLLG